MTTPSRAPSVLLALSLALVAGLAAWYGRAIWDDSGAFALALFGVPALCVSGALGAERAVRGPAAAVAVGVLAAVSLGWSLVVALGFAQLLVPALLLVAAAVVSWAGRRTDRTPPLPG